jgi:hypothetical protein
MGISAELVRTASSWAVVVMRCAPLLYFIGFPWNFQTPPRSCLAVAGGCLSEHNILCSGGKDYAAGNGLSSLTYEGINIIVFQYDTDRTHYLERALDQLSGITVKHYILCF